MEEHSVRDHLTAGRSRSIDLRLEITEGEYQGRLLGHGLGWTPNAAPPDEWRELLAGADDSPVLVGKAVTVEVREYAMVTAMRRRWPRRKRRA